jgi:hypothetical protein
MAGYSNLRASYSSVVQVRRLVAGYGPGRINGAANYTWGNSTDIIDDYWGVPGQMQCRLDVQFIRPGSGIPMPAESPTVVPRLGTVFYDIPDNINYVRSGDHLQVISGAFEGNTFEIRVIPEPAQDYFGPTHMEAQIVEIAIDLNLYPGVDPGSITR